MKRHYEIQIDAIKFLKSDQQEIIDMFEKFENLHIRWDNKHKLAIDICDALNLHSQIEEEILYPTLRDYLNDRDNTLIDEALVELGSIKDLIYKIETGFYNDLIDAQIHVLWKWVNRHVNEDKKLLFPKLKKSDLDLKLLGARLAHRKMELQTSIIDRISAWIKSTLTAVASLEVGGDDADDEEEVYENEEVNGVPYRGAKATQSPRKKDLSSEDKKDKLSTKETDILLAGEERLPPREKALLDRLSQQAALIRRSNVSEGGGNKKNSNMDISGKSKAKSQNRDFDDEIGLEKKRLDTLED